MKHPENGLELYKKFAELEAKFDAESKVNKKTVKNFTGFAILVTILGILNLVLHLIHY